MSTQLSGKRHDVSARTNKFLFRSATTAGLLSAAAIIASAIPASAASIPASAASLPASAASLPHYVALIRGLGFRNDFACVVATHNVTAVPLSTAANGGATRVWLHGIGYPYCIPGHTSQAVPTKYDN